MALDTSEAEDPAEVNSGWGELMDRKLGLKNFKDGKLQASSRSLSSQYMITCFLAILLKLFLEKGVGWLSNVSG